ncbi:unnamed protein product [Enterobius vermicularis]|uniref:RBR-type E3 ubiquitin transferase n=1 Tax=Enterobius vermicularis TaxID=51028 RepID=A0A0N4VFN8_ENTVE|nr:unnamed protein product [Enterobius vermicularis]
MVFVNGEDYEHLCRVKSKLDHLIDGDFIDCTVLENKCDFGSNILLTNIGQEFLRRIESEREGRLVVTTHFFKQCVQLQGDHASRVLAKGMIQQFLEKHTIFTIDVSPPNYLPGTMTAFMDFVTSAGQEIFRDKVKVVPDFIKHKLHVDCSEEDYQAVLDVLRTISVEISKGSKKQQEDRVPPQCVVCLDYVDPAWLCFESCGHYACKSCFLHQVNSVLKQHEFPINCAKCCRALAFKDIVRALLDGDEGENLSDAGQFEFFLDTSEHLEILANSALSFLVSRNSNGYRYCRVPDCRGVIRVTGEERLGSCDVCSAVYCMRCGSEDHRNMNCELYSQLKSNVDSSLRHWMEEDPDNRQFCPKCNAAIQKDRGCNHMQCEFCKTHFCWVCFMTAHSCGQLYAHLNEIHGGNGLDFLDRAVEEFDPDLDQDLIAALELQLRL